MVSLLNEITFCDDCPYSGEPNGCNRKEGECKAHESYFDLVEENADLRDRLEKAATFALDMCSEDDCAGDGSVGLPPCDMWHAWDTDENGVNIESGCHLKEYLTELKGG